jgi:hypothetical protein
VLTNLAKESARIEILTQKEIALRENFIFAVEIFAVPTWETFICSA